jgi:hypothetical protein
MAGKTIRLACMVCDRMDFDGITEDQLEEAKKNGWTDIHEEQSYPEAIKTYEAAGAPPGHSAFDWWTHLGHCPDHPPD